MKQLGLRSLIAIFILAVFTGSSWADIRCKGQLVGAGASEYALLEACGEPIYKHTVNGGSTRGGYGDESYWYYKIDNTTVEVHLIDGHVYTIGGDINRH